MSVKINQGGFTLVELMIGAGITSLVAMAAFQMAVFVNQSTARSMADLAFSNLVADISNRVSDRTQTNDASLLGTVCAKTFLSGGAQSLAAAPVAGSTPTVYTDLDLYDFLSGQVFLYSAYNPSMGHFNAYGPLTVKTISFSVTATSTSGQVVGFTVVIGNLIIKATVTNQPKLAQMLSAVIPMSFLRNDVTGAIVGCSAVSPNSSNTIPLPPACAAGSMLVQGGPPTYTWQCRPAN